MPEEKKYKYNAYCCKDLHTNSPMTWIFHLRSCPGCLKAIPQEEIDYLNDNYGKNLKKPQETDNPSKQTNYEKPEKFAHPPEY